ncbi:uncharacterized protein KY384_004751 [Bacidia gigantensis]|uniref:uncharacterized protein n=1 Tax=Bacidia gigantensis TaxID=2732470 RepID=UPI001D0587A5|nr:uncharacterized protein KY384_004751 [Bacidia gigantensis]KAG8530250.1 hypothetical protein KY384_004751 [Bacidia gigantensis]
MAAAFARTLTESQIEEEIRIGNKWREVVIDRPVSDDIKTLVKDDLLEKWHHYRDSKYRDNIRPAWHYEEYRTTLTVPEGTIETEDLHALCNKPTAFYWLLSAQHLSFHGTSWVTHSIIFQALLDEWLRCYDCKPNIEYGHCFAAPIKVSETGPSTLRGVIDAHAEVCRHIDNELRKAKDDAQTPNSQGTKPDIAKNYFLLPLFRAIVMVIDNLDGWYNNGRDKSDDCPSVRRVSRYQNVLLLLTGVETGLSAPISFQSLIPQSLFLDRSDIKENDAGVIRVPLCTAIQFIVALEKREHLAAGANSRYYPPFEPELCPSRPVVNAEVWADSHLFAAEKHGWNVAYTDSWEAIRRVKAGLEGELFYVLEPWVPPGAYNWKTE